MEHGLQLHPKDERFYQIKATLQHKDGDTQGAMKTIAQGLEQIPNAYGLMLNQIDLQISTGQNEAARASIQKMRKTGVDATGYLDYLYAMVLITEKQWIKAERELVDIRGIASQWNLQARVNFRLGLVQEQLGKYREALDSYTRALNNTVDTTPELEQAAAKEGVNRMIAILRPQDLGPVVSQENGGDVMGGSPEISKELAAMYFDSADAVRELIELRLKDQDITPVKRKQFAAQQMMTFHHWAEAQALVNELIDESPDDMDTWVIAYWLAILDPDSVADHARLLQRTATVIAGAKQHISDATKLRVLEADYIVRSGGEDLRDKLHLLEVGLEKFPLEDQVELWTAFGKAYRQARLFDACREAWKKAALLSPNNLKIRIELFRVGQAEMNDAHMKEALDLMLEQVDGDKPDATWKTYEASRLLTLVASGQADNAALDQAARLVREALVDRPTFSELYILQGDINARRNNLAEAIENYEKARRFGVEDQSLVIKLIEKLAGLYLYTGNQEAAQQILSNMPSGQETPLTRAAENGH